MEIKYIMNDVIKYKRIEEKKEEINDQKEKEIEFEEK